MPDIGTLAPGHKLESVFESAFDNTHALGEEIPSFVSDTALVASSNFDAHDIVGTAILLCAGTDAAISTDNMLVVVS